jgi:hypothetical protein
MRRADGGEGAMPERKQAYLHNHDVAARLGQRRSTGLTACWLREHRNPGQRLARERSAPTDTMMCKRYSEAFFNLTSGCGDVFVLSACARSPVAAWDSNSRLAGQTTGHPGATDSAGSKSLRGRRPAPSASERAPIKTV